MSLRMWVNFVSVTLTKITSSILAAMMAFVLMSVSYTDETPAFVVSGPGVGQIR